MSFADCLGGVGFGFCIYSTLLIVINLKLLLESRFWSWPLVASVVASVAAFSILNLIMAYLWVDTSVHNGRFLKFTVRKLPLSTFYTAVERMGYYKESSFREAGVWFDTKVIQSFPINMQLLR